jgi:hypothetical protein
VPCSVCTPHLHCLLLADAPSDFLAAYELVRATACTTLLNLNRLLMRTVCCLSIKLSVRAWACVRGRACVGVFL